MNARPNVSSRRRLVQALLASAAILAAAPAEVSAAPFDVQINTSALSGGGLLAFDLFGFDAQPGNNAVTVTRFDPAPALVGPTMPTGDVTGQLPGTVVISDSQFFGEALQQVNLGGTLSFALDVTTSFSGGPGDPNDLFGVFLLDPASSFSLINTDLLQDALLLVDIVGGGQGFQLSVASITQPPIGVTVGVPLPGGLVLVASGLTLGLAVVGPQRRPA
jgi:hypothetical protein